MILIRILDILRIVARYRLDRLIPTRADMPLWAKLVLPVIRLFPAQNSPPGESLRLALEELGPIFIKLGQMLSTRKDLFPPEIWLELEKLQDQVPPFDSTQAMQRIEANIDEDLETVFSHLEPVPMASASVAQVHSATLVSGEEVVVKVIRPGIEARIKRDLKVMFWIAGLIERAWAEGKRLHPVTIVEDYEHTILNELNLQIEASNTARLRENWLGSGKLYVPRIYWDYSTRDVMVMERIYGVTASDIDTLVQHNVNLRALAHLGVEIFFTQVFEDNFFHADMHPGNVFVDISDPDNPTYIALDCAIIGSLSESDKNYLARNLLAFFHRDYRQVAQLHVDSNWVPADTNVDDFEAVIRSVCEPNFQKPIKDISFGKVLVNLFNTARQFNMEVQPQLVLLQKTLLNIEGMGRQIYDELDLWETAAPYMESWMQSQVGVRRLLDNIGKHAPRLAEELPLLPELALDTLRELRTLGETNRQTATTLAGLREELALQRKRARFQRLGGIAILVAFVSIMVPMAGQANEGSGVLLGTSVLGSLGIYWLFIHS